MPAHDGQWSNAGSHRWQRLLHILRFRRPHHQSGHPVRRAECADHRRHASASTRWRSCRGTASTTSSPRTPCRTARTCGRCVRSGCAASSGRARSAASPPSWGPAPWSCPINWWTAPRAATTPTSTRAASMSGSPTRTARRCGRRRPDLPGVVDGGTMVVIQGPRFSTRAESRWFASQGFTLVNMTGYPEAVLARELEMCYAAIALVTDLDAGIETGSGVQGRRRVRRVRAQPGAVQEAGARGHRPGGSGRRTCTHCLPHDGVELPFDLP